MQNHKGVEHLVPLLDVPGDLGPVFHGHVAGVQQWAIFVDAVDDAIAVKRQPAVCVCVCVCVQMSVLGIKKSHKKTFQEMYINVGMANCEKTTQTRMG